MSPEARAFVSLGANCDEPARRIKEAVGRLKEIEGIRFLGASSFYLTEPVGPIDQPPFVNAVAEWSTRLPPADFLVSILGVEKAMGRKRSLRWGPRLIDIDLLLYADRIIEVPDFRVPHPRMHERRFVLEPLAELAPEAVHPAAGKTAAELLAALPGGDAWVRRMDESWD